MGDLQKSDTMWLLRCPDYAPIFWLVFFDFSLWNHLYLIFHFENHFQISSRFVWKTQNFYLQWTCFVAICATEYDVVDTAELYKQKIPWVVYLPAKTYWVKRQALENKSQCTSLLISKIVLGTQCSSINQSWRKNNIRDKTLGTHEYRDACGYFLPKPLTFGDSETCNN